MNRPTFKIMEVNMDTLVPRIIGDTEKSDHKAAGIVLNSLYPDNMIIINDEVVGDNTYKGDIIWGIANKSNTTESGDSTGYVARKGNTFIYLKDLEDYEGEQYIVYGDAGVERHKLKPLEGDI